MNQRKVVLETEDIERLAEHFVAKHRRVLSREQIDDFGLYGLISTVMLDTMLVLDGNLTVEDFAPKAENLGTILNFETGERMDIEVRID